MSKAQFGVLTIMTAIWFGIIFYANTPDRPVNIPKKNLNIADAIAVSECKQNKIDSNDCICYKPYTISFLMLFSVRDAYFVNLACDKAKGWGFKVVEDSK